VRGQSAAAFGTRPLRQPRHHSFRVSPPKGSGANAKSALWDKRRFAPPQFGIGPIRRPSKAGMRRPGISVQFPGAWHQEMVERLGQARTGLRSGNQFVARQGLSRYIEARCSHLTLITLSRQPTLRQHGCGFGDYEWNSPPVSLQGSWTQLLLGFRNTA